MSGGGGGGVQCEKLSVSDICNSFNMREAYLCGVPGVVQWRTSAAEVESRMSKSKRRV